VSWICHRVPLNGTKDVSLLAAATLIWVESAGNTTRFSLTEHWQWICALTHASFATFSFFLQTTTTMTSDDNDGDDDDGCSLQTMQCSAIHHFHLIDFLKTDRCCSPCYNHTTMCIWSDFSVFKLLLNSLTHKQSKHLVMRRLNITNQFMTKAARNSLAGPLFLSHL